MSMSLATSKIRYLTIAKRFGIGEKSLFCLWAIGSAFVDLETVWNWLIKFQCLFQPIKLNLAVVWTSQIWWNEFTCAECLCAWYGVVALARLIINILLFPIQKGLRWPWALLMTIVTSCNLGYTFHYELCTRIVFHREGFAVLFDK